MEWRAVVGFEDNYEVSSCGQVRSLSRMKPLAGHIDRHGYRRVFLWVSSVCHTRRVHRLVCEAWHGPCPAGLECAHLDGNPGNNTESNLAWVSRSENMRHRVAHGTVLAGEKHTQAKLSEDDVREMRRLGAAGWHGAKLARAFGISGTQAYKILTGRGWAHVK